MSTHTRVSGLAFGGLQAANAPTYVGLDGLEPSTSSLSGMRSSQLSYRPSVAGAQTSEPI